MICPKCGSTVPDGMPCPCGAPMLSSNPAVNLIKTLGSSTKFLAAAILYSVVALLAILSAFSVNAMAEQFFHFTVNFNLGFDTGAWEAPAVVGAIFSSILTILIAVGMWLFYSACRNRETGNVSTVGLTFCKVIVIISLVSVCLAIAFMLLIVGVLLFVLAFQAGEYFYYGGYEDAGVMMVVQVVMGVLAAVLVATLVLFIFFYVSIVKVINRIKASAVNGVPDNRIPGFLTGFLMFLGVINALNGVLFLIISPLAGIASLAGAACCILMSLLLKEYRKKMTALMFPPVQPVYGNMPPYGGGTMPMPPYDNTPPQQPDGQDGNAPQ